jgi:hypothetical protein
MKFRRTAVTVLALSVACADARERPSSWHGEPPLLIVATAVGESLRLAPVVMVPAPAVAFRAIIEPDPLHMTRVIAPHHGLLASLSAERHVTVGDTVAQLSGDSAALGAVLRASTEGTWRPRRAPHQFVLAGDTVGVVVQHGFWLAVGAVSDLEHGVIHVGDPATVLLEHAARRVSGQVEAVHRPGTARPYSAEVSVEFAAPEDLLAPGQPRSALVTVQPSGAGDSVVAVPAAAVVHLDGATAAFVPYTPAGTFRVQWLLTGPEADGLVVVRRGVERGQHIVTGGVAALALAARESLRVRSTARRR